MVERVGATDEGKKRLEETEARKRGRSPGTIVEEQRPKEREWVGAAAASSSTSTVPMDQRDTAKRAREQTEASLGALLLQLGYDVHLSELYNPERFKEETNTQGLCFGDAFDMKVPKPDGQPWDLSLEEDRRQCKAVLGERRPLLLIGSPMCTVLS